MCRRRLPAAAGALALAAGGFVAGHSSSFTGEATVTTGCVVRFYSSGPALHQNGAHACTAATGVWVRDNGVLVIDQTHTGPVVSVTAQADETLVARGVQAGVSGGVSDAHVTFYDSRLGRVLDLTDPGDYRRIAGAYSNLWFQVTQISGEDS